jgi:hypothetical protein
MLPAAASVPSAAATKTIAARPASILNQISRPLGIQNPIQSNAHML